MKNHLRKLSLLIAMFALTGVPLTQVHAESVLSPLPPVALPEAMTSAQMKAWKAELATKTAAQATTTSTPGTFYTGKPYIAETGGYAFKYREYNPEMARWTTVDPSGFPDGANNRVYAAVPTSGFDDNGLRRLIIGGNVSVTIEVDNQFNTYVMHKTAASSTEGVGISVQVGTQGTNSSAGAKANGNISLTFNYNWVWESGSPLTKGYPGTFPINPPAAPTIATSASFWIGTPNISDDPMDTIVGDKSSTADGATYTDFYSDVWTESQNWGYYE